MRKIVRIITIVLLASACVIGMKTNVLAKEKDVTLTDASLTTNSVKVAGTTEALAVMVQVRDASGTNILFMGSVGTKSAAFSDTLTGLSLTEGSEYTVYVADYEGGNWTIQKVKVPSTSGSSDSDSKTDNKDNSGSSAGNSGTNNEGNDGKGSNGSNGSNSGSSSSSNQSVEPRKLDTIPSTGQEIPYPLIFMLLMSATSAIALRKKKN